MKNLKKKLAILATATLLSLSLGSSIPAMQGTEKYNLRLGEEITKDTDLPKPVKTANLFSIFRDFEEERKDLERVFYGVTANENLVISMALYKNITKKLGENNNYVVGISFHDSSHRDEKVKYTAIDDYVIGLEYQTFTKELEKIDFFEREEGGGRTFGIRVFADEIPKDVGGDEIISDAIYGGIRYYNQETGKMEDLVYVIKLEEGVEGDKPLFKGYGNGHVTLQDTDGDKIEGLDKK